MMKQLRITVDGKTYDVLVEMLDGSQAVLPAAAAQPVPMAATASPPAAVPAATPAPTPTPTATVGTPVPSPLSGTVVDIHVKDGQAVKEGDLLITLEAMKMNTPINAPKSGTISGICVQKGAVIDEGATILTIA